MLQIPNVNQTSVLWRRKFKKKIASCKNHTRSHIRVHKPHPISDQNGQNLYPISDQKRLKNHTIRGRTYLYSLYKGVPPGGWEGGQKVQNAAARVIFQISKFDHYHTCSYHPSLVLGNVQSSVQIAPHCLHKSLHNQGQIFCS